MNESNHAATVSPMAVLCSLILELTASNPVYHHHASLDKPKKTIASR